MPYSPTHRLRSAALLILTGCASTPPPMSAGEAELARVPASRFDLSSWSITVPTDADGDGKADTIESDRLQRYSHRDYFYLDAEGRMVFATPNKATTTKNSSNTRSELRYMSRGSNTKIPSHAPGNNFAVAARRGANEFGSIGGRMEATLHVDHVARNAAKPEKFPAYSAVVGQIHAVKYDNNKGGFGFGNEPLKIFYKKWPHHAKGSVFWTYERNLAKDDPKRRDIVYPVWGATWDVSTDPGERGIALGETFSYVVNVHENTMYLVFDSPSQGVVRYQVNLANNVDARGEIDGDDHPQGYGGDSLYFKAGIYNQCSTSDAPGFWYAACAGTGDWSVDYANGDFAMATFSKLVVSDAVPM